MRSCAGRRTLHGLAASLVVFGAVTGACQRHAKSPPTALPLIPAEGQGLTGYVAMTRAGARRTSELALQTTADAQIAPVPLDPDQNGPKHGALYTPFLLAELAVRDARAHGRPVGSGPLGGGVADIRPVFVVAAYPLVCGRTVSPPIGLRLVELFSGSPSRRLATPLQEPTHDARLIFVLLPGERLPPRSLVGSFRTPASADMSVEVDYGAPTCPDTPKTLIFPVTRSRPTLPGPAPIVVKLPAALSTLPSPTVVQVMGVYDATGRAAFPGLASGPVELAEFAEDAVRNVLGKPDQLNGLLLPSGMMHPVTFTATGEPPPPVRAPMSSETAAASAARSRDHRARLALEIAKLGPIKPMPLDKPGLPSHGFAYDNNMLGQLTVRTLLAGNPGVTPGELPMNLAPGGMLIVALPLACGTRHVVPTGLSASWAQRSVTPSRQISGQQLKSEFPELAVPDDALAAFLNTIPIERADVVITYGEPACPLGSTTVTLTAESTPARVKNGSIQLRFPDGVDDLQSPISVQVDGEIDALGHLHLPMALNPVRPELGRAAEQAAAAAVWEPRTVNGVPVSTAGGTNVRFSGTGQSLSISPYAMEASTFTERGLSRETSRCAASDDPAYGTRAQPIPVGGDDWRGVAYERAYLGALRGPNGQGITYRILGAEFVSATKTFLDVFEVTYDGMPAPVRLYLDEYRSAPLRAPAGFTCAVKLPR